MDKLVNVLIAMFLNILKGIIGDPDKVLDFALKIVDTVEPWAVATATKIDDLLCAMVRVTAQDAVIRQLFRDMWADLQTMPAALDREALAASPAVTAYCRAVGGRLNIDWQKVLELILKYLPMILPIFLDKDDAEPSPTN
ncbi:MAG: hypothetical protein WC378_00040 [Opitutaceae bacterium]|jgi:hypothetical protein